MKNKATALNVRVSDLLKVLQNFKASDYIDVQIQEYDERSNKIIIRLSPEPPENLEDTDTDNTEDIPASMRETPRESIEEDLDDDLGDTHEVEDPLLDLIDDEDIQNPKISTDIPYKDLLDNLN